MLKYRGGHLIKAGFMGVMLIMFIIIIGLQPKDLMALATSIRYQALFEEAGGLVSGNTVAVSGVNAGSVSDVELKNGEALVTFSLDSNVVLGSDTTAHIRTGSLLGERVLTLESAGTGRMDAMDLIPISRTGSPYSLTDAVTDLTNSAAEIKTGQLNESLDALSETFDEIAPELGPTFDGLTRLSQTLNSRDDSLRALLKSASEVTGILSERSQQLNTLILNANDLLGVLVERRDAVVSLLANVSAVAQQLTGLVADNEAELAPTLVRLNRVLEMLENNRDSIAKLLPGLQKFQITQGEAVSNGYYYNAFIPNLGLPQLLQPFWDYMFGFRRGVDAGQPPDNAGPRAELPFPYNAIPPASDMDRCSIWQCPVWPGGN